MNNIIQLINIQVSNCTTPEYYQNNYISQTTILCGSSYFLPQYLEYDNNMRKHLQQYRVYYTTPGLIFYLHKLYSSNLFNTSKSADIVKRTSHLKKYQGRTFNNVLCRIHLPCTSYLLVETQGGRNPTFKEEIPPCYYYYQLRSRQ